MPSEPSIRVGTFEVVPLLDGSAPLPLVDELPGRTVDWNVERSRFPWAFASSSTWAWHVRAFLVRAGEREVLVDTGIGHLGRPPFDVESALDGSLADAGSDPNRIDHVVHTHLHMDHAGGSCRSDGRPRFPRAIHHVHPGDWSYFGDRADPGSGSAAARAAMTSIEADGRLSLVADDVEIVPGVRVLHAPGHTPGHRCVVVDSHGDGLLLTGDLLHLPIQVAHPEWASSHDVDPMLGTASRRVLLFRARARSWRVGVSHFARPFGSVTEDGWSSDGSSASADAASSQRVGRE